MGSRKLWPQGELEGSLGRSRGGVLLTPFFAWRAACAHEQAGDDARGLLSTEALDMLQPGGTSAFYSVVLTSERVGGEFMHAHAPADSRECVCELTA